MPDDKLKILYDNLIGTGKITQKEMGDFPTFSKLMSDSTNVRTFYDNITSGGIVSPNETGDFNTFYKFVSESIQPPQDFTSQLQLIDTKIKDIDSKLAPAQPWQETIGGTAMDQSMELFAKATGQPQQPKPQAPADYTMETPDDLNKQRLYLEHAKDLLTQADKYSKVQDAGGFEKFGRGLTSPLAKDFFSAGISEMVRNFDIVGVARKAAEGKPLSDAEQSLLVAYGTYNHLLSKGGDDSIFSPYLIGQQIAMQIPYMVQFAATAGIGNAAKGGVNTLLKVTEASLKDVLKDQGYKAALRQIGKELPGIVAKGAAQTPFMPMTYTIMGEKMIGEVDQMGNVTNQPTLSEGIWKGLAQAFPEVLTESMGAHILGSFNALGKGIGKKIPANVTKLLTPVEKFRKAAAFGSFTEEFSEEMMNNVLTPMLDPDTEFKDVWTAQNILTTALTIAATGGGFYAVNQAYKSLDENGLRSKYLSGLPKDVRTNVIGALKSDKPEEVSQLLSDIISKSGLQPQQAKGILDYAWAESMRKGMAESLFEQNKEIQKRQIEKGMQAEIAPFVYKDGKTLYQVATRDQNVYWIKDGEISVNPEGHSWTLGKKPLVGIPLEGGEPVMIAPTEILGLRASTVEHKISERLAKFEQEAELTKTVQEAEDILKTEAAEAATPDLKTGDIVEFNGREAVIGQVSGSAIDARFTDTDEPVVIEPDQYQNVQLKQKETGQPQPGSGTNQPVTNQKVTKVLKAKVGKNELSVNFTPDAKDNTLFTSDNSFSQESDANKVIKSLSDRYSGLEFTTVNTNTDPFAENNFVITAKPKSAQVTVGQEVSNPVKGVEAENVTTPTGGTILTPQQATQAQLEQRVKDLRAEREGLRDSNGNVSDENIQRWKDLNPIIRQAERDAARGNSDGQHISIKTAPKSLEENPRVIADKDQLLLIEAIIENIIKTSKTVQEAVDRIRANYVMDSNNWQLFLRYLDDRINNKPEVGNNKQSFSAWRKGVYDKDLQQQTPQPNETQEIQQEVEQEVEQEVPEAELQPEEEGLLNEPPIKKWTVNRSAPTNEQAPIISYNDIDLELSGFDAAFEDGDVINRVELLEYRGKNQYGQPVGTVVIKGTFKDGTPFREKYEVQFKKGFSKSNLKEPLKRINKNEPIAQAEPVSPPPQAQAPEVELPQEEIGPQPESGQTSKEPDLKVQPETPAEKSGESLKVIDNNYHKFTTDLDLTENVSSIPGNAKAGKIGKTDVVVYQKDGNIAIESVWVPWNDRKQGEASKAMQSLTDKADELGVNLELRAVPSEDSEMTAAQLKTWYEKFGFKFIGNNGLRTPGQVGGQVSGQKVGQKPVNQVAKVDTKRAEAQPISETPQESVKEEIKQAEKETDTNPSEAQKKAGNYKHGKVTVQGMEISIENPKGSTRSGTDQDGKKWSQKMAHTYGYFLGSEGYDGDHVDVFIGENPEGNKVFVVDQVDTKTGEFDESKVMLGFNSVEEAKRGYLANYEKGWQGLGQITETTVEDFKTWLYDGAKQRLPYGDYKDTPTPVSGKSEKPTEQFVGDVVGGKSREELMNPPTISSLDMDEKLRQHNGYLYIQDRASNQHKIYFNEKQGSRGMFYLETQRWKQDRAFHPQSGAAAHLNPILETIISGLPQPNRGFRDFNQVQLRNNQDKPVEYFEDITINEVPFPEDVEETPKEPFVGDALKKKEPKVKNLDKKKRAVPKRIKDVMRDPQSFEESVLQFLLGGGRFDVADFERHTGFLTKASKDKIKKPVNGKNKTDDEMKKAMLFALRYGGAKMDTFGDNNELFGMDDRGAMDVTNEIVDIIKSHTSVWSIVKRLEELQSTDANIPSNAIDPDWKPEDIEEESSSISTTFALSTDRDINDIINSYGGEQTDWASLLNEIETDPGTFTVFPYGLNQKQFAELKKIVENELQRKTTGDQAVRPTEGESKGDDRTGGTAQHGGRVPGQTPKEREVQRIKDDFGKQIADLKATRVSDTELRNRQNKAVAEANKKIGLFGQSGELGEQDMFAGEGAFGTNETAIRKDIADQVTAYNNQVDKTIAQLDKEMRAEIRLTEGQEEIRFQLTPEEPISDNLVALHNINEGDIRNVDKLGGMVAPSIAIVQKETPFTDFGEITLIADKETVDPKNSSVKVFKGDVYSPTVPSFDLTDSLREAAQQGLPLFRLETNPILSKSADFFGDAVFGQKYQDFLKFHDHLTQMAQRVSEQTGTKITVVKSAGELPAYLRDAVKRKNDQGNFAPALFYDKDGKQEVWLISNQTRSTQDAGMSLLHEVVGHRGLRLLLGEKYEDLLRQVWAQMPESEKRRLAGLYKSADRLLIADEWIAKQAETLGDKTPLWVRRALAQIRQWLRDLAGVNLKFTDNDLASLFTQSRKALQREAENRVVSGKFAGEVIFDKETLRHAMTLYHGTPHDFDKFSSDKIGTGEGAQAYGYGLYFTDLKEVAEWYADRLVGKKVFIGNEDVDKLFNDTDNQIYSWVKLYVISDGLNKEQIVGKLEKTIQDKEWIGNFPEFKPKIQEVLRKIKNTEITLKTDKKTLITATIHKGKEASEYDYLRWDKDISDKQMDKIKVQLQKENINHIIHHEDPQIIKINDRDWLGRVTGEVIYNYLSKSNILGSQREASAFLLRAGIDGIKYPAESRGDNARGFNYVVFDENAIEIEDKLRFQIIGEQGAQRLVDAGLAVDSIRNLQIAKDMESAGKSEKEIWLATGWQKGKEGKWRMEAPDISLKIKTDSNGKWYKSEFIKLSDVINDNNLFKAYPSLRNIFMYGSIDPLMQSVGGEYKPGKGKDTPTSSKSPPEISIWATDADKYKEYLIHEIQHHIQFEEGFSTGSNSSNEQQKINFKYNLARTLIKDYTKIKESDEWKRYAKIADDYVDGKVKPTDYFKAFNDWKSSPEYTQMQGIEDEISSMGLDAQLLRDNLYRQEDLLRMAREAYTNNAGEVEARNAQTRLTYDDAQRAATMLSETEDVDRNDQIVLMDRVNNAMEMMSEVPQTETEAFKKWFGDSKVANENGTPKVVYHGTDKQFTIFKGYNYFTASKSMAAEFSENNQNVAEEFGSLYDGVPTVMPVYLSIQNPYIVDDYEDLTDLAYNNSIPDLIKDGYDGAMAKNMESIVVFSPTQIKSATGNIGTFDETNPDIRFSLMDDVWSSRTTDKVNDNPFKEGVPSQKKVKEIKQWLDSHSDKYKPEYVKFYHGTGINLPIENEGLKPTSQTRRRSYQSKSGYVYLANTPERAKTLGDLGNSSRSAVYEVIVPVRDLLPDTDQLNNQRAVGEPIGNSVAESIIYGGGVRIKGKIEPWQIMRMPEADIRFSLQPGLKSDYYNEEAGKLKQIANDLQKEYNDDFVVNFNESNTTNSAYIKVLTKDYKPLVTFRASDHEPSFARTYGERIYPLTFGESERWENQVFQQVEAFVQDAKNKRVALDKVEQLKKGQVVEIDGVKYTVVGANRNYVTIQAVNPVTEKLDGMNGEFPKMHRDNTIGLYGTNRSLAIKGEPLTEGVVLIDSGDRQGVKQFTFERTHKPFRTLRADVIANKLGFYPQPETIRFSLQPPPPAISKPYTPDDLTPADIFDTGGKIEDRFNKAIENVFDNMLTVKFVEDEVERRGGKFNAHSRPYRQENMSRAQAQAERERFDSQMVKPFEKAIADILKATQGSNNELTYRDVWIYLVAKHAPERNRDLGGAEGVASGSIDGIKLTDEVARWYIDQFENNVNNYDGDLLQKLWDARNRMTRFTLDKYLTSGMITREVYDKLTDPVNGWKDYVPYRGWKDSMNELFDYQDEGAGGAYSPFKKAEGRISEADDPTVYMISMGHTAIAFNAKNYYKQQMANLILLNPDIADQKDLFWFKRVYRVYDTEGNIIDEKPQNKLTGLWIEDRGNGTITVVGDKVQDNKKALQDLGGKWDISRRGYTFGAARESDIRVAIAVNPGTVSTRVTKIHESRKPIYLSKQHEVDVWINGERAIMVFADPKVAHALNKDNTILKDTAQTMQETIGKPTRYLAQVLTSKNPAFWPVNMTRDIGYAWAWHAVNEDMDASKFLKNIPIAIKASHRYLKGNTEHLKQKKFTPDSIDAMYERWRLSGGETSYFRLLDVEKLRKNVDKDMQILMGELSVAGKFNENVIGKAGEWLGIYSQLSENISRFATYLTAYEQYRSKGIEDEEAHKRAVADSKNVTVNFDKYGRVTPLLKGLYLFIGPNLGGVYNMGKLAAKNKKAFAYGTAAFMAIGLLSAEIARLLSPPDDEDPTQREYDTLNDFIRENYLVLPNPAWLFTDSANESFITIPMPQGFRAFSAAGVIASDIIHGKETIGKGFGRVAASIGDAFMPVSMNFKAMTEGNISAEKMARPLIPDVAKPFWDILVTNEDFAGRMITRTPFTTAMEERLPEFTEARRFNNPYIVMGAKMLNRFGGGDDLRSATFEVGADGQIRYKGFNQVFDQNPARIEYLIEAYTGGVGMELNNTVKTLTSSIQKMTGNEEAEIDSRNIPILRRFYRTATDENAFSTWGKLKKEVDDHVYFMNKYKSEGNYQMYNTLRGNTYMQGMKRLVDRTEKRADKIEEVIDWKQQSDESVQAYYDKMEDMYKDAIRQAKELKDKQK